MLQLVGGGDAPVAANERRADQSVIFRSPISLTSRCELTELLVLPFSFGAPSAVAALPIPFAQAGARGSEERERIVGSNEWDCDKRFDCLPKSLTLGQTQLSCYLHSCCNTLLTRARTRCVAMACNLHPESRLLTLAAHQREQIVLNLPISLRYILLLCVFLQGSEARQSLARHRGLRQDRRFRPLQGGHGLRRQDRHILRHARVPRTG